MSTLELVPEIRARREQILAVSSPAVRRRILGLPIELPAPVEQPKPKQTEKASPAKIMLQPLPDEIRIKDGALDRPETIPAAHRIRNAVAEAFGVAVADLTGPRRFYTVARPRQAAYLIMRERMKWSTTLIGRFLGDRDHTTVLSGLIRALQRRELDPDWRARYEAALAILDGSK